MQRLIETPRIQEPPRFRARSAAVLMALRLFAIKAKWMAGRKELVCREHHPLPGRASTALALSMGSPVTLAASLARRRPRLLPAQWAHSIPSNWGRLLSQTSARLARKEHRFRLLEDVDSGNPITRHPIWHKTIMTKPSGKWPVKLIESGKVSPKRRFFLDNPPLLTLMFAVNTCSEPL
jgi:hypothetical protein